MRFNTLRASGRWALWLMMAILLPACSLLSPNPEQSYQTAVKAHREGRVREARIALLNALQGDPDHRAARLLQARLFLDARDGVAAEAEITRARQSGAPPSETRHLQAHARLLQNDVASALAETRDALAERLPPEQLSYVQRVAGLAELARGDQVRALAWFDRALAANPRDAAVWLEVARFRRSIGDLGPAILATDRAVAANPNDAPALVLRGELSRAQYGLAAAIPWFDRALEVDPGNLTALLERATTHGDMGRMTAMLADSRAALAIDPSHPLPFFLQATLAARARQYDLARSLFGRTRRAYDRLPAGILLAAALAYEAEDYEGASQRLAGLVQRQPGNWTARRLLAAARWRVGDPAGTIDAVRLFVDRPDADSYTLTLVAAALERQGNAALAARYRERAAHPQQSVPAAFVWSDSSRPEVAAIGRLLVARNADAALVLARRRQAAMPGAAEVHLLVGDVLAAGGQHGPAAQEYRRAANLAFTEATATRLAAALGRAGRQQAADAVLRLFAAQNPRNVTAQSLMASRALQQGHWNDAVARFERLRGRLGNGDAVLLNNLAWAYAGAGDDARALLFARRAWALAPANPATADTLGWTLFRQGDVAEGLALLHAASRGRPAEAVIAPTQVAGR